MEDIGRVWERDAESPRWQQAPPTGGWGRVTLTLEAGRGITTVRLDGEQCSAEQLFEAIRRGLKRLDTKVRAVLPGDRLVPKPEQFTRVH